MVNNQIKKAIVLAGIMGVSAAVLTFTSCQKDHLDPGTKPGETTGSQVSVQSEYGEYEPEEEDIVNMLAVLQDEFDNITVSDRPIDEAIWTLETYFNYMLANPHKKYSNYNTYTFSIELDEVDEISGMPIVEGSDILAGYESVSGQIGDLDPETPFIIDLEWSEVSSGVHTIGVTVIAGEITSEDRDEDAPEGYVGDPMKCYGSSTGCLNFPNYFDAAMNGNFAWSGTCSGGNLYVPVTMNSIYVHPSNTWPGTGGGTYGSRYKLYQHPTYSVHYGNYCLDDFNGLDPNDDVGGDETVSGYLHEAIDIHSVLQSGLASGQYIIGFDWTGIEYDTQTGSPRYQYHMQGRLYRARWVCIPVVLPAPM